MLCLRCVLCNSSEGTLGPRVRIQLPRLPQSVPSPFPNYDVYQRLRQLSVPPRLLKQAGVTSGG